MVKGLRAFALTLAALSVASCGAVSQVSSVPTSPVEIANRAKLDEQLGISMTTAYTAVSKAAGLAIETGMIKNPDTIKRLGVLDKAAYDAVMAVRAAYLAANSTSYLAAARQANDALKAFLEAVRTARTADAGSTSPAAPSYLAVLFYQRSEAATNALPAYRS